MTDAQICALAEQAVQEKYPQPQSELMSVNKCDWVGGFIAGAKAALNQCVILGPDISADAEDMGFFKTESLK